MNSLLKSLNIQHYHIFSRSHVYHTLWVQHSAIIAQRLTLAVLSHVSLEPARGAGKRIGPILQCVDPTWILDLVMDV